MKVAHRVKQVNQYFIQNANSTLFHVHGLLCALISGPCRTPDQEELSASWGKLPVFYSMQNVPIWRKLLLRLHHQITEALRGAQQFFPLVDYQPVKPFTAEALSVEQKRRLVQWCEGYLYIVRLAQKTWINENTEDNISRMLWPICFLGLPETISSQVKKKSSAQKREAYIDQMIRLLSPSILAIYEFWRGEEHGPISVLCLCGSGQRFENCCCCRGTVH